MLRLDPIVAVAHPDNLASRRALGKLGFQHVGPARYYGTEVAFYRLHRSRYLAARVQPPAGAGTDARPERD